MMDLKKQLTKVEMRKLIRVWVKDNQWMDAMGTNYYDELDAKQIRMLSEHLVKHLDANFYIGER